jgi:lipopolysaccharide export system protein LptC
MNPLNVRNITSEGMERINPLLLPLPWLVVLALLMAFAALKYSGTVETPEIAPETAKVFPQIYLTDVQLRQFDKQGQAHYEMTSPLIQHFQVEDKASERDYTLFQTPVFMLSNDPAQPAWFITSQEARRDSNGLWFTLSKDVLARQTSAARGEITISTSELRLNTQQEYAETSKAVTMRDAKNQMSGLGLRADIKNDRIAILSNVKGNYAP